MDNAKKAALAAIDEKNELIAEVADSIWDYAELSMQEVKSAALFVKVLKEEGFQVEEGICGIPTAFSASYGSGRPVMGSTPSARPRSSSAARLISICSPFPTFSSIIVRKTPCCKPFSGKTARSRRNSGFSSFLRYNIRNPATAAPR